MMAICSCEDAQVHRVGSDKRAAVLAYELRNMRIQAQQRRYASSASGGAVWAYGIAYRSRMGMCSWLLCMVAVFDDGVSCELPCFACVADGPCAYAGGGRKVLSRREAERGKSPTLHGTRSIGCTGCYTRSYK